MKKYYYSDELEEKIGQALQEANILFTKNQRLDFFLPDFDVFIEVKKYHSDRSSSQLASEENVILLQGAKSISFFCKLLKQLT